MVYKNCAYFFFFSKGVYLELRVLLLVEAISPALKSLLGTSTVVFNSILTLDDVLDGRIAVDIKLVAEFLLNSAIDFSNNEGRLRVGLGEFLPGRSKTLAVTAPWGKELDGKRLLGELSLKGLSGERKNTNLLLRFSGLLHFFLGLLFLRLLILGLILTKILVDVIHVSLNSARDAAIFSSTTVGDELDGGEATDAKAGSKTLLNSAIDLSNMELVAGLLSKLDPGRSETLAVTTPWGKELDEPETFLGHFIKVLLSKNDNLRVLSVSADDTSHKGKEYNNRLHYDISFFFQKH